MQLSQLFSVSADYLITGSDNIIKKDNKNYYEMNFWAFMSEKWWVIIIGYSDFMVEKLLPL